VRIELPDGTPVTSDSYHVDKSCQRIRGSGLYRQRFHQMSPAKREENEDNLDESGAANIQEVRKDLYEESDL
jgi:hypothetical protein